MFATLSSKMGMRAPLAAIAAFCLLFPGIAKAEPARNRPAVEPSLSAALCQVVYPLDESPEEGYRYMFLGNGFFVNDQGYVVTAAHLLSYFRHGGEPYILVGPRDGTRRMIEAPIVAADWDHDVAVLHPTPNPFRADKGIAYLPLSVQTPAPGDDVLTASLLPPDVLNAHSLVAPVEDSAQGEVIKYQFYDEQGAAERQLLLFDQEVVPGQSGAPLVSAGTHAVVGVVVGRWLHPTVATAGAEDGHITVEPGAALRIHYAIGLLEQLHVHWDMASEPPVAAAAAEQNTGSTSSLPVPLSLVAAPYPPEALFGGEVLMDARVDADGRLVDVRVVSGDSPFTDAALGAVRTWSFVPARIDERAVESRIGIVFQFPQSFLPNVLPKQHKYQEPLPDASNRGAVPVMTVEPGYPPSSIAAGSVILYGSVDAQGQLASLSVLRDVESLATPAEAAIRQWQFASGLKDGAKTPSSIVVVVTFRRPTEQ